MKSLLAYSIRQVEGNIILLPAIKNVVFSGYLLPFVNSNPLESNPLFPIPSPLRPDSYFSFSKLNLYENFTHIHGFSCLLYVSDFKVQLLKPASSQKIFMKNISLNVNFVLPSFCSCTKTMIPCWLLYHHWHSIPLVLLI